MDAPAGGRREVTVDGDWREGIPRVADALRRGTRVRVETWGGREIPGVVCDREQTGMLLESRDGDDERPAYLFLPWSSVQQIRIEGLTQRRVKHLP